MCAELAFDYKKALKRQNFTQNDVDELREKVKSLNKVPPKLSDKKVWNLFLFIAQQVLIDRKYFHSAFVLFKRLQWHRRRRECDSNLLRNSFDVFVDFFESRSIVGWSSTKFWQPVEFLLAQHAIKSLSNLSLPVKPESIGLRFPGSLQNILHDLRFEV